MKKTKSKWPPRKLFAATLLAALAAWPGVAVAQEAAAPPSQQAFDAAFRRVSDKLICQCGCNYGLTHCPHLQCPSAPVMRAAIRDALREGKNEEQVIEVLVAQFGPAALAAPPAEGFNLTAWLMPFVALGLGLWVAVVAARRWRARAPALATPAAGPAALERYRASAAREIEKLEE